MKKLLSPGVQFDLDDLTASGAVVSGSEASDKISFVIPSVPIEDIWILAEGVWNDEGRWIDTAIWIDDQVLAE